MKLNAPQPSAPLATREGLSCNAWCTGLFLVLSFSTVSSLMASDQGAWTPTLLTSGASFVRAAAFLAVALLASRIGSLLAHPRAVLGAAVTMGACAFARACGALDGLGSAAFAVQGALLFMQNGAYVVLYLGWMELYAQMDLRHGLVYLSLVHLASALTSFALFLIGRSLALFVLVALMPLLSAAMLRRADSETKGAFYRHGESVATAWSISPRPLILLGAFTLTNTFLRSFLGTGDKAFVLLGVGIAALGVLAMALWRFDAFEPKALYQLSVPVLVAGALCVLMSFPGGAVAGALCSNAAFTLFSIFITVVFCAISYRYGVNALWLFGITQASLTFGSFLGNLLPLGERLWVIPGMGAAAPIAVLVVVLVALSMLLVSDRDFETTWGVAPREEPSPTPLAEEEATVRRCAKVAKRYGLTRREEEILVLMMRGHTLARIGGELFVAESTMKTHSRHIYRKAGVANRQELQELVEAYPL